MYVRNTVNRIEAHQFSILALILTLYTTLRDFVLVASAECSSTKEDWFMVYIVPFFYKIPVNMNIITLRTYVHIYVFV